MAAEHSGGGGSAIQCECGGTADDNRPQVFPTMLTSFFPWLLSLIIPVVLVLLGAAIAGVGLTQGWSWLFWTGLVVAGIGVLWGICLCLFAFAEAGIDWWPFG